MCKIFFLAEMRGMCYIIIIMLFRLLLTFSLNEQCYVMGNNYEVKI